MSDKDRALAWNGAVKPRPPSEGFATSVGVDLGSTAFDPSLAAGSGRSPGGDSFLEQAEGPQVDVQRMGEASGPEVVRPTGRVRLTRT